MTCNDGSTSDTHPSGAPSHDNASVATRLGGEPLTVTARGLTFSGFRATPGSSGNDGEGRDPQMAILVHGWPQFASSWEGIARELLARGIAVVAYDQRAYSPGARPDGVENYTVAELTEDLDAIATELGIERFHLIGHDWGGVMAWMYAAWHPERLHSLTVMSTPNPIGILETTATDEAQQKKGAYITGIREDPEGSRDALLADGAALLRSLYGDAVPAGAVDAY
ncbi:alpha/beta fold hydrolase, partial [Dietzia sp.]|uniref:alpha/beta fold hydrolase n=1 Tax=Dietzia sp. TaxID=1871616 RepID=UPI002FDAE3F7